MFTRLESNRSRVLERLASACRSAGRDPREVRLVAVTKSVPAALAAELCALGCLDLGESRADELEAKHAFLARAGLRPRWHFVGHLQRNKARRVLQLADEIHSVDSLALYEALARAAETPAAAGEQRRRPGIYLQVKLADEAHKSGLDPAQIPVLIERVRAGPLPLLGLMTMAPLIADEVEARRAARAVFERAAALARELPAAAFAGGRPLLSMGMSQDFEEALRAGADVVRVGSALFEGCALDARGAGAERSAG